MNDESQPDKERSRRTPIWSTLLLFVFGVAAIAGVYVLSLGTIGPILIIVVGIFALAALHYVTWGWWLGRMIRSEVEAEERENEQS